MNFLKILLASLLGTVLGIFLLVLILFISIIGSTGEPEPYIRSGTVLTIELQGDIPPRTVYDPFSELFAAHTGDRVALDMLKVNLEKAADDERISGIWLKMNPVQTYWANLESAFGYLEKFRESGKFIYASTDDMGMNENAYFLAAIADSIFSPPETYFEFNGFVMQTSYYSRMLERIGVEPEIMRVGAYKSAVEPFLREDSSQENREQMMGLLENVSGKFIRTVENRRGLTPQQINVLLSEIPENSVESALEAGLIDGIVHPHEVENVIKQRMDLEEDEDLRTVSFNRYSRVSHGSAGIEIQNNGNRIAVIYASGMIIPRAVESPYSTDPVITAKGMEESLRSALDDDDVRAIVIHIDSGGGAVSTSELIWGHIGEAAKEKPVIAYMGGVAASGGYYIAMGADTVVASPNTITGSIGIYNLMFNSQELFNEKLGIHFDEFKTHEHADFAYMNRPLTESERMALQRRVENGYETFLRRVAEGRDMSRDAVHEVAQGRIWTGTQALELNLVDMLGTLEDALAIAAEKADIEEYDVVTYPERKELFDLLFSSTGAKISGWAESLIPLPYSSGHVETVKQLADQNMRRNWAVLPLQFTID